MDIYICIVFITLYMYVFKDCFSSNPIGFQFFTVVSVNYDLFSLCTLLAVATMHPKTMSVTFFSHQS